MLPRRPRRPPQALRRAQTIEREPLHEKPKARQAKGHSHVSQPHHAWVSGADCAVCRGRGSQHPLCARCSKTPGGAGPHATRDRPQRY